MPKLYDVRTFTFSPDLQAVCHTENTRYGFRHLAQLMYQGHSMGNPVKVCYYNRTWEAFMYQTVLLKLADLPNLSSADRDLICSQTKKGL